MEQIIDAIVLECLFAEARGSWYGREDDAEARKAFQNDGNYFWPSSYSLRWRY